jgi:hypothetical protein
VEVIGSLSHLSNELIFLEWHRYPLAYLPSSFHLSKLVLLNLHGSKIKELWGDKKVATCLFCFSFSNTNKIRKKIVFIHFFLDKLILKTC